MSSKTFKTLDEQIEILKNKGLIIDNKEEAKEILLRENYFFINGYRHVFLRSEYDRSFLPGTNFRELCALFVFDRKIRNILFKNILIIENNLKSVISYQLSRKYGYREKDYLKPTNFDYVNYKKSQVNDLLKKMQRQIRINGPLNSATSHYQSNYGYIPLWILVKVLSFGIVCELFSIMKYEDRKDISAIFEIDPETLYNYLPILANYRNLCAHEDITYDNKTQKIIEDTKYHSLLNIPMSNGDYIYGKNDLFALVIIIKQMLRSQEFSLFMEEISIVIDSLTSKLKTIKIEKVLDKIGFPTNYKDITRM